MKNDSLFVKHNKKLSRIVISEIAYIEGMDDYIRFVLEQGTVILVRKTMANILSELTPYRFIRVHKSFIVPLGKLESVSAATVTVAGRELPLSRTLKQEVISAFTGRTPALSGNR